MITLGQALGWKHNHAEGITTRDGVLTEWPVALGTPPTEAEQAAIVAEYEAHQAIMDEILRLEALETPRRIAEAHLTDEGKAWIVANRDLIATERAKL